MDKLLKYFYRETSLGKMLVWPIKKIYSYYRLRIMPDKIFLKKEFRRNLGYELNLNHPETLNEKFQWLKLYDRTNLHTLCADKYAVREYIKKQIGDDYLIPLLYTTKDPKDIRYENIPDVPCIIKTNHASGSVTIVMDKKDIDFAMVRKKLKQELKANYYYRGKEWQYKNIEPRIIVEKLLLDKENKIPYDYKLHCFNGKFVFTQVDANRFDEHKRNLYDTNWNIIDCEWRYPSGEVILEPKNMARMKELAEKLAAPFDYVRVDFYSIENTIYFGELTFNTESGWGKFSPIEYDKKFGDMLVLTNKN